VAQRDRATIGVQLLLVGAEVLEPSQRHRRERLVDLEDADLVDRQTERLSTFCVAGSVRSA